MTPYLGISRPNLMAAAILGSLLFIPVVNIGGVIIPTVLFLIPLLKVLPLQSDYVDFCVVASAYLSGVVLHMALSGNMTFRDVFYIGLPLLYLPIIAIGNAITEMRKQRRILYILHTFLFIQLGIIVLQLAGIDAINQLLHIWLQRLTEQLSLSSHHAELERLSRRPAGTIVNPTWTGMAAYIIAKPLTEYTEKQRYVGVAFLIALLTGARMALLTIIVVETLTTAPRVIRSKVYTSNTVLYALSGMAGGIVVFFWHPFFEIYAEAFLKGQLIEMMLANRSVTHRIKMFRFLFEHPSAIFIGGFSVTQMPSAHVDSEFVMRTLQFGIVGYLAFKAPLFALFIRSFRIGKDWLKYSSISLLLISVLSSLTMTTSSNVYFIILYAMVIALIEAAAPSADYS